MNLPLCKDEWNLVNEVVDLFKDGDLELTDANYAKYKDILELMSEQGYILISPAWGSTICIQKLDLNQFKEWLKRQDKEAKKISRREYKIAIVSAITGAIAGMLLTQLAKIFF